MEFFKTHKNLMTAVCAVASLAVAFVAGKDFYDFRHYQEVIIPGPGVTSTFQLSDYNENLKGTFGDTTVYVMEGEKEGGSFLVLGGTHPNEPSGHMAAITMVESGKVEAGTVYVIPRADNSAFTHNDAQEGSPHFFHIDTKSGTREFVFGSRASNPIDQWPDPDVYTHSSGQTLSGSEMRNINRTYPGVKDGTLTEQISYAITNMINTLDIDMEMDLHEASPEYPTVNATVAHERAMSMASMGVLELQMSGVNMSLEPSPATLHGLTHRELGDFTNTLALLMETGNPSQGRLHGKTGEALILTGKDDYYKKAYEAGYLYIPYDAENGVPLELRVGRQLQGCVEYMRAFSDMYGAEKGEIVMTGLPTYEDLTAGGHKLGEYLN